MRSGPRDGFHCTREAIVHAIDLWHRQYLRVPTADEWRRAGENHPAYVTVIRRFGSWNTAIRAPVSPAWPDGGSVDVAAEEAS
jgi:hypothetical protein